MGEPPCYAHLLDEDGNLIEPPEFALEIRRDAPAEAAPGLLDDAAPDRG